MLAWEHDYNLTLLEEFWKNVNQGTSLQDQLDEMKEYERNLRFVETNLDDWSHLIWQSYTNEVASALSQEEFNQSYRLHNTLDMFSARRKSLATIIHGNVGNAGMVAYNKQKQLQSRSPGAYTPNDIAAIDGMNQFVHPLWDECMRLYTTCQQIGRPIAS